MNMIIETNHSLFLEQGAQEFRKSVLKALQKKEWILVGISGGRIMNELARVLAMLDLPWQKISFVLIDERLVPSDSLESNYLMLKTNLFDPLQKAFSLPPDHFPAFLTSSQEEDPKIIFNQGAQAYEDLLRKNQYSLDLLILSMGEDGHIASLFPEHFPWKQAELQTPSMLYIENSPKPPTFRMSLKPHILKSAPQVLLYVSGEGKKDALKKLIASSTTEKECPAAMLLENTHITLLSSMHLN